MAGSTQVGLADQLKRQIELGSALTQTEARTVGEVEELERQIDRWHDYSYTWLSSYLSNAVADEYRTLSAPWTRLYGGSQIDVRQGFLRNEVVKACSKLESILDRLSMLTDNSQEAPAAPVAITTKLGALPSGDPVRWSNIRHGQLVAFRAALDSASNEADMQAFLEKNPEMLTQYLAGSHECRVIPKKRLGSEFETDFLIGREEDTGFTWYAVELERPQAKLFTRKGDPTADLTHALRQIDDWRSWLSRNRDYASRPREQSGLGLVDIDPELVGLIILGREADVSPETDDRRRRLARQHRVDIHTYDWLADRAQANLQ